MKLDAPTLDPNNPVSHHQVVEEKKFQPQVDAENMTDFAN